MKTSIESLETRIAPAGIQLTYVDIDGDKVTITASKGSLTASNLTLSDSDAGNLLTLSLTDTSFSGADITFTVKKGPKGDGRADLGTLDATGVDLGTVTIKGDVSRVFAGDANTQSPAFLKLQTNSFGEKNLAAANSSVIGGIDSFIVKGNVNGSQIFVHGNDILNPDPAAQIDFLKVGKSLMGGDTTSSGNIHTEGGFGDVIIGRDILGGAGKFSGRLESDQGIGTLRVGGSIVGSNGDFSGSISADTGLGTTKIRRDLIAGGGLGTGAVRINASIGDIKVGRDLVGNTNSESGLIWAKDGSLGKVVIGRNVIGGDATGAMNLDKSGSIVAHDSIASVRIGGSLVSGADNSTGTIKDSGAIRAGKHLGPVSVGGSITGNETNRVLITGVAMESEPLEADDLGIDKLTVGQHVRFANILAGFNLNGAADNADASIGPVKIGKTWSSSNLVAGALDSGTPGFGVGDTLQTVDNNPNLVARIASITIGGKVVDSTGINGFVAQQIDLLKIAGKKVALASGPGNDASKLLPSLTKVYVEEVG